MQQNSVSLIDQAKQLGLLEEEFHKICEILGREPNFTELSIYSVMWSEHCSYKNSITWLKTLPKSGTKMLAEAGEENAGLVDIGDGLACCFKIESHNHPSAIEPYQGAATGVGGINRDIFSMGARPIAQLNSLRFGNINTDRTKWLMKGVVKGIGDYGTLYRLVEAGDNPIISIQTDSKDLGTVPNFNTIAEIKGTEKPDEYVMLSAHFDSWDGGQGATDNGTGTLTMMEAMRILKLVYPNPKRTILVGSAKGLPVPNNTSLVSVL